MMEFGQSDWPKVTSPFRLLRLITNHVKQIFSKDRVQKPNMNCRTWVTQDFGSKSPYIIIYFEI